MGVNAVAAIRPVRLIGFRQPARKLYCNYEGYRRHYQLSYKYYTLAGVPIKKQ